jgi:hypothetical protein
MMRPDSISTTTVLTLPLLTMLFVILGEFGLPVGTSGSALIGEAASAVAVACMAVEGCAEAELPTCVASRGDPQFSQTSCKPWEGMVLSLFPQWHR